MATIAEWLRVDGENVVQSLQEIREKLGAADGELVLDFSLVRRIAPNAISAMENLASAAEEKTIKIVLRKVSIEVYKVLKLVRLTRRFSFVA